MRVTIETTNKNTKYARKATVGILEDDCNIDDLLEMFKGCLISMTFDSEMVERIRYIEKFEKVVMKSEKEK